MSSEYEYDYSRIADDADELLCDDLDYSSDYTELEYSDYYFKLAEDIE